MPGDQELLRIAEPYLGLGSGVRVLSVACGTGELELYLAEEYGCTVMGIDISKELVTRAKHKAASRGLEHLVQFAEGDGNSLVFDSETFDVVFCSGALYAFHERGIPELFRVLTYGGKGGIIETVWTRETVPSDVRRFWTEGTYTILTLDGNRQVFKNVGFTIVFSAQFDNPRWWEAYYDAMGDTAEWRTERENYKTHRDFVALGLFVLEKGQDGRRAV